MDYITKNNNSKVQLSTLNERINNGQKLYIAAWTFEILAAIIGLLVAFVTGMTAYESFASSSPDREVSYEQLSDVILGFVPFIMVALAEILKIPMSYLVYINRHLITKLIFSIILVSLTFITFETVSSGFERQFSNITSKVRLPLDKMRLYSKELELLEESINKNEKVNTSSVSKRFNNIKNEERDQYHKNLKDIDDQILMVKANIGGSAGAELKLKQAKFNRLTKDQKEEVGRIREDSAELQASANRISKDIQSRISKKRELYKENEKIISDASLFCFSACKSAEQANSDLYDDINTLEDDLNSSRFVLNEEVRKAKSKYQSQINNAEKEIERLSGKVSKSTSNSFQIESLNSKKSEEQERHQIKLKEVNIQENKRILTLVNLGKQIEKDKVKALSLRDDITELNKETGKYESVTQIYRFTKYYMNFMQKPVCLKYAEMTSVPAPDKDVNFYSNLFRDKEAECLNWSDPKEITTADVTMEDVSKVAFVWFGSLAFLVSIMGVVLAFGAFILKHPNNKFQDHKKHNWSLTRSIRMLFTSLLKKSRKPKKTLEVTKIVEIIKEVPVDKVVFQEVPVEVVKKEVIHTPIYTNDPDLLKFGTTKIKDVLKTEDEKEDEK